MKENMRNWFGLFIVGAATPAALKAPRHESLLIAVVKRTSTIRSFLTIASPLVAVACTSVMVQTPQQMSNMAINMAKVDPQTDPKPQTLAADQVACANTARLQYPIGVDEAGIMSGSILGGALGGAASGAAGSAGTGNAGQATAAGAVGGVGQGGLNGMDKIKHIYVTQAYHQAIHNALCLEQQGHVVYGFSKHDETCARVGVGCPM
jgi:hypothetical protein